MRYPLKDSDTFAPRLLTRHNDYSRGPRAGKLPYVAALNIAIVVCDRQHETMASAIASL